MKDRKFIREMMTNLNLVFNPQALKDNAGNVILSKSEVRKLAMEEVKSDFENYVNHGGKIDNLIDGKLQ